MKRVVALVLGILFVITLRAQVLTFSGANVVQGYADEAEIVLNGFFKNNSNDTVTAKWQRIENVPSGWLTAICDDIQCWSEFTSIAPLPLVIPPQGQSILDIHYFPDGIAGSGSVTVKVWVIGDSANTVATSSAKTANVQEPVGVNSSKDNDNIRVYPNPASDYFLIRNLPIGEISTVEVYNIFGRKMLSFSQAALKSNTAVHKFDIAMLAKGIYMVRVFDASMNVIFTKSLTKD